MLLLSVLYSFNKKSKKSKNSTSSMIYRRATIGQPFSPPMLNLLAALLVAAKSSAPTVLTLASVDDFVGPDGARMPSGYTTAASVTTNAPFGTALRSGSPPKPGGIDTSAGIAAVLTPGVTVESVTFSYRQITGYATTGPGPNFTLTVAGIAAFRSAPLDHSHPYPPKGAGCPDGACYSPAVPISVAKLAIKVPTTGTQRVVFDFHNTASNLQFLLPMNITISCGSSPCTSSLPPSPPPPPPPPPTAKLLPSFFDDNMVLQRAPASAVLYGFSATPGETVTVELMGGKSWTSTVAANGSWTVALDPQPATTGVTITVTASTKARTLKNVAFGDVFLCSGQSNMGTF